LPKEEWRSGVATYYTSDADVPLGVNGAELVPFCSVAVRSSVFKRHENERVEIQGWGIFRVADRCTGSECEDFDIFIGANESHAQRLPNWQAGNIPIEYRWLGDEETEK
jgi:3D (Asp-Asp-Asp) domain-containing protein